MVEQVTISPIDGLPCVRRQLCTENDANAMLQRAQKASQSWRKTSVKQRCEIASRMVEIFVGMKADIAREITQQMGRPIRYTPNEINGYADRARYMCSIAEQSLADKQVGDDGKFKRFIRREPLGIVLVIPAWNYPLLTAVNGVVPALLAGNCVLLKHSQQTPLCAERIQQAFEKAGLPEGVLQVLHASHSVCDYIIKHPLCSFVNFTGSVSGGRSIQQSASAKFIGCGLELGGNDPAYVRPDANLNDAVENLVDGAMFNSGQCCCGIQRIYVHERVYDEFVRKAVELTNKYILGDPMDQQTTLGPMVKSQAADAIRADIADAVEKGAKALIDPAHFPCDKPGSAYLAPQILVNVNHTMRVMIEESFGPIVGVMKVKSDEEAIRWMNDSQYGLTAAIWTQDQDAAVRIGNDLETGTVFQNRCDYVDPGLAWTGVKNTGIGCTLSSYGFLQLTRPKSFHLKTIPAAAESK